MNITVIYADKYSSATQTLSFEARSQAEFNQQLATCDNEAGESFAKFSRDVETLTGDDTQLERWLENFEAPAHVFQPIAEQSEPWMNDHLQFARLLHEQQAAGAYGPQVVEKLMAQMNCSEVAIVQLLERASAAYAHYRDERRLDAQAQEDYREIADKAADAAAEGATGKRWKLVDATGDEHDAYEENPDYPESEEKARAEFARLAAEGRRVRLYSCDDDGEDLTEWELDEQANQEQAVG